MLNLIDEQLYVDKFLKFLQIERSNPDLAFLNKLIKSHQIKVRWENLTKILDSEKGQKTEGFLPPLDMYIDRIVERGGGGTCWTLAIGFRWLLERVGFNVSYLHMDPGHLCLRVDLDQPYYVDIGYTAPLFQAYPLLQSFTTKNEREEFTFEVNEGMITVSRNPGPLKTLSPTPVSFESLTPTFKISNNWSSGRMLQDLLVFGYIDGVPTSLTTNTLKQFLLDKVVKQTLTEEEIQYWIREKYKIDLNIYFEAKEIFKKRRLKSSSFNPAQFN